VSFGGNGAPQYGERTEPGPDDFCYRHKDRPSFTLCQRCGRTICSECQTVSSVGVLCADCVRAAVPSTATRAGRKARVFTRKLSDQDRPVVTYTIMAICGVVFLAQLFSRWFLTGDFVTAALWYAPLHSLPQIFEPWRMVTSMFTHSPGFIFHILFNMYALWLFGPNLERMLGRLWFSLLYVFGGLGGSLAVMFWVYFAPDQRLALTTATVGASGAIFALLTATFVALRANRVNVTSLAVLIGINFAIGFIPGSSISWQAHLGGMLIGALTMWVLLATRGPRKTTMRAVSMIALGAVLVGLAFAYFVVSPVVVG
jgi:membrane associated rhomboid family serine protease